MAFDLRGGAVALVLDLDRAREHARAYGAPLAAYQPQEDVRVCLDPVGHPFCLWVDPTGADPATGEPPRLLT